MNAVNSNNQYTAAALRTKEKQDALKDAPKIYHAGISGGKDSTALLLWMVHESGYPKDQIRASFCDTGNEHEMTYEYVRMLSEKVHPIEWLKPERDFYELAKYKKRFPSPKVRFCTTELKLNPSKNYLDDLAAQGFDLLLHTGVRAGESPERAQLSERDIDSFMGYRVFRPLLRWSIDDVWAMHRKYAIPRNPLYDAGCKRVGCLPCIMSRKSEVRLIALQFPDRIAMIREAEKEVPSACGFSSFFARDKVPVSQRSKTITTKAGEDMNVATIDDVARWSRTSRGGQQYDFAFWDEEPTCSHTSGACE